jgi:hypothetical protein
MHAGTKGPSEYLPKGKDSWEPHVLYFRAREPWDLKVTLGTFFWEISLMGMIPTQLVSWWSLPSREHQLPCFQK